MGTVKWIRDYISQGKNDVALRNLVLDIVSGCGSRDTSCEIKKIHDWIRKNIKFRRDPVDRELLQWASVTVELQAGDCDDFTILESSMLQTIGIPTRIVLLSGRQDQVWEHIFLEAFNDKDWISLDASMNYEVGREYQPATARKVIEL